MIMYMYLYVTAFSSYYAVYPYTPCDDDELALTPGDIVYVTESFDDGWLVGISTRTNEYGSFPGTCVCKLRVRPQLRRQERAFPFDRHHYKQQMISMPIEL